MLAAIRDLQDEGLVVSRHGSGVFVAGGGDADPIVQQLRELRVAAGLTQEQLAARAGVSQGSISRSESGVTKPTLDLVCQLAAALGVGLKLEKLEGPGESRVQE